MSLDRWTTRSNDPRRTRSQADGLLSLASHNNALHGITRYLIAEASGADVRRLADQAATLKTATPAQMKVNDTARRGVRVSPVAMAMPNSTVETQTFDPSGQLTNEATTKSSTTLVSEAITRDGDNNPTQIMVNRGSSSETRSFLYDNNGQIQGVCYTVLSSCTGSSEAGCPRSFVPRLHR
jgi:hypothetical protein